MAGSVRVVLKSVFDDSGLKEAQKALGTLGQGIDKAFSVVAATTAAAGFAIGSFAKQSITAASDLQESTNAVNVAFGEAAAGVLAIGENSAQSFGLAKTEFNQAAVRFSAFAERVVGAGGDISGFIGDVTQRAADFASVFNIDVAEALSVFQSGLAGEAEPLKRFGINLLESEVKAYALRNGIISVGESMTETQKVQARYGLLMESTSKTAGDFANTSDGLANSQRILRAEFEDLQAEVGNALLPAVTDLFKAIADKLLPKIQEFGEFLKSPKGQKAIEDVAKAIETFFTFIIDNIDEIADMTVKVFGFIAALKLLKTAADIATASQVLFNAAVAANPYVLAGIALVGIAAGMYAVYNSAKNTSPAVEAVREEIIKNENAFVTSATNGASAYKGLIPTLTYTGDKLDKVRIAAEAGAGEFNRFNNIRLNGLRREINLTTDAQLAMNQAAFDYVRARQGLLTTAPSGRGVAAADALAGGGATGPSRFEQQQQLLDETNRAIDEAVADYNKTVARAREAYADAVTQIEKTYAKTIADASIQRDKSLVKAQEDHARNIANIQRDFAKRQADIIQQSIDRLRNAYRSAVEVNVADIFQTEEVGRSVDNLVTSLRDRLTASRRLLENSANLASAGFSQTFIEQIVGAGVETGNELASAILTATPETQAELQSLFRALEVESNTGMDTLAQTMYEKTGLATDALKELYTQTNEDLVATLAQAQLDYTETQRQINLTFLEAMRNAAEVRKEGYVTAQEQLTEALEDAATALNESLTKIRDDFQAKLKEMGGAVRSLRDEIDQLLSKLTGARVTIPETSAALIGRGIVAPDFIGQPIRPTVEAPVVVNVNVTTDQTQSTQQVGRTLAKAISSYTNTGGKVKPGAA